MTEASVMLCYKDSGHKLGPTIKALERQKTPRSWELIAVDNGSTDESPGELAKLLKTTSINYQLLQEDKKGKQAALLRGIRAAKGEILIICDDDNILAPDYIENAINHGQKLSHTTVFGGKGTLAIDHPPKWFHQVKKKYAVGPQHFEASVIPPLNMIWGAGMVIKKSAILPLIINEYPFISLQEPVNKLRSGEDFELCLILHLIGYNLEYCEDLQFIHNISEQRLIWEEHQDFMHCLDKSYHEIFPEYDYIFRWYSKSLFKRIISTLECLLNPQTHFKNRHRLALQLLLCSNGNVNLHRRAQLIQKLSREHKKN